MVGTASDPALVATRVVGGCGKSFRSPDTHEGTTDTLCTTIAVEPTWVVPVCTFASNVVLSLWFVGHGVNSFTVPEPVIVDATRPTREWVSVTAWYHVLSCSFTPGRYSAGVTGPLLEPFDRPIAGGVGSPMLPVTTDTLAPEGYPTVVRSTVLWGY